MANYINETAQGFTQVPNWILNDPELSLKAKALWAFLASKPTGWNFSAERIAAQNQDGKEAIGSGLRELERAGLLERKVASKGYRKFETTYTLKSKIDAGKFVDGKYANELYVDEKPGSISNKEDSNKENSNKEKRNLMSAPAKPAPTRQLPKEAKQLAERLHKWILKNKPNRKIQNGWEERWAEDIDKMHRLDGRSWQQILGAIDWSQRDDFWRQNVLSGANLRKHYDRIEDRARMEMEDNSSQVLASQIFSQDGNQAVETARKMGLLP